MPGLFSFLSVFQRAPFVQMCLHFGLRRGLICGATAWLQKEAGVWRHQRLETKHNGYKSLCITAYQCFSQLLHCGGCTVFIVKSRANMYLWCRSLSEKKSITLLNLRSFVDTRSPLAEADGTYGQFKAAWQMMIRESASSLRPNSCTVILQRHADKAV